MSELPALWPDLEEILNVEDTLYLPVEVSAVIRKVINMQNEIYENAPDRHEHEYEGYPWDDIGEHPSQFYPNWELLSYPKKYNVRNKKDEDLCTKKYRTNGNHAAGLFSAGCRHSITMGFEMMINQESPHNAFRLLQCRDLDLERLKGKLLLHQ